LNNMLNNMLNGKIILITGGTGSFSQKFVETVLRDYPGVQKIIIYSRGEAAQYNMRQQYPARQFPQLRFFIGDVRDKERLHLACEGVDILIHTAAITLVPTSEYNPDECVKTGINGAQNVISAAFACQIRNVISLSSDKACAPLNLFGATQLLSDKLFVAANNMRGNKDVRFSIVRYSNVMGACGSLIPFIINRRDKGAKELPITDNRITRFNTTHQNAVDMVLFAIEKQLGGEIFIPKCPSYSITDMATAIAPNVPVVEIGIRTNEKLHEQMITKDDAVNTIELPNSYAILPALTYTGNRNKEEFLKYYDAKPVPDGFRYSSDSNPEWETVDSIREKIRKCFNPNFKVK
jgi:UDP-N-acetylglucosamine 4,6-dehydratase